VDVRVGEARHHATPTEVDPVRRRQCRLVRPDAARDAIAGNRERASRREGRLHRPDRAVLEDHWSIVFRLGRSAMILAREKQAGQGPETPPTSRAYPEDMCATEDAARRRFAAAQGAPSF
jgi:hypothetical protein